MSLVVVLAFQLSSTCRNSFGKLLSRFLQLFSPVVEIFFRCYFRVTRRFMLRSQNELNNPRHETSCDPDIQTTEEALKC